MKKLVLILVAALALVGCGSKPNKSTQVLSCETSEMGMDMAMDITFKEEKVTDVAMDMKMPYEAMGMTYDLAKLIDEKEFKALMQEQFAEQSAGEVDFKLTEEAMEVSFKMNVDDFIEGGFVDANEVNETVDINEAKADIEEAGGVCTIK